MIPGLPTGTVTFLFTDIEGSTRLWERYPAEMRAALVRHDAIVESAVVQHDGCVVRPRGEGDSRFAVFSRASDAVATAASLQAALHAEPWPMPAPLEVRAALHTGEADLREGDYYGTSVNRCARLRSLARGGQTLISQATAELVLDSLPPGVQLTDLGEHALKDLDRPEHIFQLVVPGVPADFPPLETSEARPNNLPTQATPFVGRDRELRQIGDLLVQPHARLLTLTGPGGTGKTRLALQVAASLLDSLPGGAFFAGLSSTAEPGRVPFVIAQALDVAEGGGRPVMDSLKSYLDDKVLLLILDNFEQVLEAAPLVSELLSACPGLKVLVTSREALHLYGESEFSVPPLSVPAGGSLLPVEDLAEFEAVRLFVERAKLARPDFALTPDNAPAVARICAMLDGLPLAIELAAARVRLLPPQAMLARLGSLGTSSPGRLKLLTGGARDLPVRQQTLRDAIRWSYDLLQEIEQKLFRRLSVFVNGCSLDAVEGVCNRDGDIPDTLSAVSSLVDKSLLRQQESEEGEPRFWMLETIREYARESLEESGEAAEMLASHAHYYASLQLPPRSDVLFAGMQEDPAMNIVATEEDNLRTALQWALEHEEAENALRLADDLVPLWETRGPLAEGRTMLKLALALPGAEQHTPARAQALFVLGSLLWMEGNLDAAGPIVDESISLNRELGRTSGLAIALVVRGTIWHFRGEFQKAVALLEEASVLVRRLGDRPGLAGLTVALGQVSTAQGDYDLAQSRIEEGIELFKNLSNRQGLAQSLNSYGDVLRLKHDYPAAERAYEESLALFKQVGANTSIPATLHNLGHVALEQGDTPRARPLFEEALRLYEQMRDEPGIAEGLAGVAGWAARAGKPRRAARLFGASDAVRAPTNAPMWAAERESYELNVAAAKSQLDPEIWDTEYRRGRDMTQEAAVAYAFEQEGPQDSPPAGGEAPPATQ